MGKCPVTRARPLRKEPPAAHQQVSPGRREPLLTPAAAPGKVWGAEGSWRLPGRGGSAKPALVPGPLGGKTGAPSRKRPPGSR